MLYLVSVVFLFLLKPSDLSPLPKVIYAVNEVEQNKILFPHSGTIVFDDSQNEVEVLPKIGFRKFGPPERKTKSTVATPTQAQEELSTPKLIYSDKILFAQTAGQSRSRYGYIRKFSNLGSKGQPAVALRSGADEETVSSTTEPQKDIKSFQTSAWIIPSTDMLSSHYDNVQAKRLPEIYFENWASKDNNTIIKGSHGNETTHDQITFLSLFRTPNIDKPSDGTDGEIAPCPDNLRRDHHGNCRRPVRRIRYRIIEEEA